MRQLFFLYFLATLNLGAQHPYLQQITDEDGLPSMEIFDLMQDRLGYIWIGSNSGVARYDGRRFERFENKAQRRIAMSNLIEGPKGRIWMRNFGGQIFYVEKDSLHLFELWSEYEKYQLLHSFSVDSDNQLWATARSTIYQYDLDKQELVQVYDMDSRYTYQVCPAEAGKGVNIIQSTGYLMHLEKGKAPQVLAGSNSTDWKEQYDFVELPGKGFYCLSVKSRAVDFWGGQDWEPFLPAEKGPTAIAIRKDKQGDIWLLHFQGLQCLTRKSKQLFGQQTLFKGKCISDFLQDAQGNYWVSTLRSGLFRFASREAVVFDTDWGGLSDERINVLEKGPNGTLLLGNNVGKVDCFAPKEGRVIKHYDTGNPRDIEAVYFDAPTNTIYASCQFTYEFELERSKFKNKLGMRSADDYWLSDDGWLVSASVSSLNIERLREPLPAAQPSRWPEPLKVIIDEDGYSFERIFDSRAKHLRNVPHLQELWTILEDRLMRINYRTGEAKELQDPETGEPLLGVCLALGADSSLWLGTVNKGIYRFFPNGNWAHFEQGKGLNSNFIRSLACNERYLWIGSYNGLQALDLKDLSWRTYTREDGLSSNEIKDIVLLGDTVWLATSKGLNALLETAVDKSQQAPPIYLQGFSVFEQSREDWDKLDLAHNENNIRIDFLGLDFRSQSQLRYKYRLVGLDSSWTLSKRESNLARYPSLSAGTYRFEVKSVNGDGQESLETATLLFQIAPPFWERWWFLLLLALSISGFVFLFFRYRIQQLNRQSAIAQEKIQAEQKVRLSQLAALRVQMNPHFIFNALNSIQEFIFLNEKRQANNYIGKFSDLMRLTLAASNKQQVTLADEIKVLGLYLDLEKVRFEDALHVDIDIDATLLLQSIYIPSLLIQPYVENAIKHGLLHRKANWQLQIKFYPLDAEVLGCTIEDNGIGRRRSAELKKHRRGKKGAGFSMSATQKRLDLLNSNRSNTARQNVNVRVVDLYDEHKKGIGTRVLLRIHFTRSATNEHGI